MTTPDVALEPTALSTPTAHYIDGTWYATPGAATIDVVNPATEERVGQALAGTRADVDLAVAAAARAFPAWAATPLAERQALLRRLYAELDACADDVAALVTSELGAPVMVSRAIQVGLPLATLSATPGLADEITWRERTGNSLIVREPVGVVGCVTPWNYPLHQIVGKIAAALAVGCTVVVKPSEITPLSALALALLVDRAGFPAGVFNLVTGTGPEVGEALAGHGDVDMVSFTGSTRTGRLISEVASATVKPVALELGGKSANIVLDDLDESAFARAVTDGVAKCFLNSGQTCSALTRLLVPRARLAEAEAIAEQAAAAMTVGDPLDSKTVLGPLVSDVQRERVRAYIQRGVDEGARLVTGGAAAPDGLERGYYVRATVLSDVRPEMTVAQEEIFGPVLVILPYDGVGEAAEHAAVEVANGTPYGLSGGVWSADPERALRVATRMRTGQVEINGAAFNPLAPFGGYGQSGHGREYGVHGLTEFTVVKSIQL
ncbi:aldehyde dehydrogenase family protein [Streptomyces fractus]|uniref:aldehyde dehydrogenase family protein n=1 Tax=Streptomyces fractus TaxID=641806 RepID=UPI003CEC3A2C